MRKSLIFINWKIASLFAILLLCFSCDNKSDISSFYFPFGTLKEGKVYEYGFVGNPDVLPEYWYRTMLESDSTHSGKNGKYFTSTLYGADMEIKQYVCEEIVDNGMLLDELLLFFKDSLGNRAKVEPTIISRNVYPFEVKDTTLKYFYKIHFKNPFDSLQSTYLTRSRKYIGKKYHRYKGKDIECVEFALEEKYVDDKEGRWEKMVYGTELYAKGIGLIYYKKGLYKEFALEYELTDIYSMDDLKKKLK